MFSMDSMFPVISGTNIFSGQPTDAMYCLWENVVGIVNQDVHRLHRCQSGVKWNDELAQTTFPGDVVSMDATPVLRKCYDLDGIHSGV